MLPKQLSFLKIWPLGLVLIVTLLTNLVNFFLPGSDSDFKPLKLLMLLATVEN